MAGLFIIILHFDALLFHNSLTVFLLVETLHCGIVTKEVDGNNKENPRTQKASKKDPLDQAIQDHQDHPGEDSKSDHKHIWIRVGLVLASFHEVGAAGSPAEGEEGNDDGEDDARSEATS